MPRISRLIATLSALVFSFGLSGPVRAQDNQATAVLNTLSSVTPPSEQVGATPLSNLNPSDTTSTSEEIVATVAGRSSVAIPLNTQDQIRVKLTSGYALEVGLPFAGKAERGFKVVNGVTAFDNQNGSYSSVISKNDGSLQFVTILTDRRAPTRFAYKISMPTGFKASVRGDGSLSISTADSRFVAGVAPAWAADARGVSVPTHFELSGSTLTQVVDHQNKDFAYPVVADPWLGFNLIDHTTWTSDSPYSPTLSVYPTTWGRTVGFSTTFPLGGLILGSLDLLSVNSAWAETLSVTTRAGHPNPDTQSMFLQFECHFFYVSKRSPNKVSWNLDSKRPYAPLATQISTSCNPN